MDIKLWRAHIGFNIPVNPITALVAGFLGLPGVVLLILFKVFVAYLVRKSNYQTVRTLRV